MENLALGVLIFVLYMSFVYPLVAQPSPELIAPKLNDYAQAFSVEPESVKVEESQSVATESLEQIPDHERMKEEGGRMKEEKTIIHPSALILHPLPDPWSLPLTTEKTSRQIVLLLPTPQLKLLPPRGKRSSVNRYAQMTVKQLRIEARLWNKRNPERQISQISKLKKEQLLEQLNTLCA